MLQTLNDLKEARDRLNMTPENSSRPPGSMAPWDAPLPSDDGEEARATAKCAKADASDKDDRPGSGTRPDSSSRKRVGGKPSGKPLGAKGVGRTQQLPIDEICPHAPLHCAACAMALPSTAPMQAWTAWAQVDIVPLGGGKAGLQLRCTPTFSTKRPAVAAMLRGPCRAGHLRTNNGNTPTCPNGAWWGLRWLR